MRLLQRDAFGPYSGRDHTDGETGALLAVGVSIGIEDEFKV
jgi:hypothetical protein